MATQALVSMLLVESEAKYPTCRVSCEGDPKHLGKWLVERVYLESDAQDAIFDWGIPIPNRAPMATPTHWNSEAELMRNCLENSIDYIYLFKHGRWWFQHGSPNHIMTELLPIHWK
jgi:hypothetical protein